MKTPQLYRQVAHSINRMVWGKQVQKWKLHLIGKHLNDGWLAKGVILYLLAVVAYLYLQPMLYIVSTMFKNVNDLIDPTVKWIPRSVQWDNFDKAWNGLKYPIALTNTLVISVCCSTIQVFICAITGYGLAKFPFPGRGLVTFFVILTFLVPPQIIVIPLYMIYSELGWLDSPLVFIVPAIFGQGMRSALFIFIFRQFFMAQPASLEEAAKMDGASVFRMFFRIMLPLAKSACLVVFLFSFIWYWNMYYEAVMFLPKQYPTLAISLERLPDNLAGMPVNHAALKGIDPVTEGAKMAAAFMIIGPPLLLYMFAQRWFVRGIERSGLVE